MDTVIFPNTRYYRWVDDELEVLRIVRYQNTDTVRYQIIEGKEKGTKGKIEIKELNKNYKHLLVDGVIFISVAHLKSLDDITTVFIRRSDMDKGITLPYAVCRQCVDDIFHHVYSKDDKDFFGLSISRDSCPANVQFENFLACNSVSDQIAIAYYIGDKLSDILDSINTQVYDDVLLKLFEDHCEYASSHISFIKDDMLKRNSVDGYVKDLRSLLESNNFEYDIQHGLDIIPTTFNLAGRTETPLPDKYKKELEFIVTSNIGNSLVLKYDKDIDLSKVNRLYKIVTDINNDAYIILYDVYGEYHVPVELTESAENIAAINNTVEAKSVREVYNYIRVNTDKYN